MKKKKLTLGVIGDAGKCGRWFRSWGKRKGYKVIGSDVGTMLSNRDVARGADIIIVAVLPMKNAPLVIREIAPVLGKKKFLICITSVKTYEVRAIRREVRCEAVAIHHFCSPTVPNWRGQNVAVCEIRLSKWRVWVEVEFLRDLEATVTQTTAPKHDRYTSVTQNAPHSISIALVSMMRTLGGVVFAESMRYSSPVYRLLLIGAGRVLSQDPRLLAEMQMTNPNVPKMLRKLEGSIRRLRVWIQERNLHRILEEIALDQEYLGTTYIKTSSGFFNNLNSMMANILAEGGSERLLVVRNSDDRPGDLYRVLQVFARRRINLFFIYSLEAGHKSFRFFFGVDRDRSSPEVQRALTAVRSLKGIEIER
ncbi:MAG: prephenate dehydrogenase/arogenate dehydrogenase family protein [Candidatus Liptonbacteria bacterium]|nr:prephenate dehydrogenase/arogenate dehydrogenase family protein [Candidatus Liptonbacteria bacterium]